MVSPTLQCSTGELVPTSEEYRRFAAECLKMARSAIDDQTRAVLSQMAQVWFRLAEEKANGNRNKSD